MVQSRRPQSSGLLIRLFVLAAVVGQTIEARAEAAGAIPLQLEVTIEGKATETIAGFDLLQDGRLAARRSDLATLGLPVPREGKPDDLIILNDIPRLKYRYDEEKQSVELRIIRDESNPYSIQLRGGEEVPVPASIAGLYANYSFYGSAAGDIDAVRYTGASVLVDAHGFSKRGTLAQSQILGMTPESDDHLTRLDTTYSFSSIKHVASFNAGDIISGGLAWTAPIRMGGLQLKRDFAIRPDLITTPLPSFRGSAAVPSTLEVFVNNVKQYSDDVPEGAFELQNIPTYSGSGVARIVLRDAQGRETIAEQPFYSSPSLLKPGLYDFSVEAGFPRRNQGTSSFDYDERPAGSASLRYGLKERLTVEGHGESTAGLVNGGAGVVMNAGALGVVAASAAASLHKGAAGVQLQAGWEFSRGNFYLSASAKRGFGAYADVGIASAEEQQNEFTFSSVEQLTLGYGFPDWRSNLGAGIIHSEDHEGTNSTILSANFSQQLPYNMSFQASGFVDLTNLDSLGAGIGFNMPLGQNYSSSTGLSINKGYAQATTSLAKASGNKPGSYGWRVAYGDGEHRNLLASANYLTSKNDVIATVQTSDDAGSGTIAANGAVVVADGDLFLTRRIGDAFTIVDVGHPNVEVFSQNRPVGKTGRNGKILVTDIVPYHKNKVEIETDSLPINSEIIETEAETVVARNSGSIISFKVATDIHAAVVVFKFGDGAFVPAGSIVKVNGRGDEFVVGYDGQAYLTGLQPQNTALLEHPGGSCKAHFGYASQADSQVFIDGVACQ
jgi:outer membrane usher protein